MNDVNKGINFKHFTIQNGRSFEKVNVPLSNQGIVLIQGDNGVGKSSLWDIFEAVLYGSTPDEHKKDELTKNDDDATYTICFEKNDETYNVSLKRKKGKWSYDIQKDNTPITEHNYNDTIKSITKLINLSKAEFEGSVHLTQSSQHILIKSELAERKKYISNFFGIDDRYDQIHLAAKNENDKVIEQISKLSGLSHTKQMLEAELQNLVVQDIDELQNRVGILQKQHDKLITKLNKTTKDIEIWGDYKKYYPTASLVENPEDLIGESEKRLIENKGRLKYIEEIRSRNEQALKVNAAIDDLERNKIELLYVYPLQDDQTTIPEYEKELQLLNSIKSQNDTVQNLRKEIKNLPKVEEIPIEKIEKQLLSLQVEYQTHAKNKLAKENGICVECGSKFNIQDVQKEVGILLELRENIDLLNEDYTTIKDRNSKVKRRKLIESHLDKIPKFSKENEKRIDFLTKHIPRKKEYLEVISSLKILTRMEITEGVNVEDIPVITANIQDDINTIEKLKKCQLAKGMLPEKPKESEEDLFEAKNMLHTEILNLKSSIQKVNQTIGEYKNTNDTHNRLYIQLEEINKKLNNLDELKKEEFFWNKVIDAYGPKGLRIQQLEKMMDLIIKQLPVYSSVLFKEKKLTFEHKVDPNNVRILACREEVDEITGDLSNRFKHDISCFSGGEKDLMSVSFILTLADCVPHHKKANILILDEVDAQLDADGKYRFTNQLLPMLRKKHDTIFVISHNKEVQLANIYDQVWEIQKINHVSSIKMTQINNYN